MSTTINTAGTYTITLAEASTVVMEVWAGGGGGGINKLGGASGGQYSKKTHTLNTGSYTLIVGAGGAAGSVGGDSSFVNSSTQLAKGGLTPSTSTGGRIAAAINLAIGDIVGIGGAGGNGNSGTPLGGAGGACGNINGIANDAVLNTPGVDSVTGSIGGVGGLDNVSNGSVGTAPGAGGGGAGALSAGLQGGAGTDGRATYTILSVTGTPTNFRTLSALSNQITLGWDDASNGLKGTVIQISTDNSSWSDLVYLEPRKTSCVINYLTLWQKSTNILAAATTYYFRIAAFLTSLPFPPDSDSVTPFDFVVGGETMTFTLSSHGVWDASDTATYNASGFFDEDDVGACEIKIIRTSDSHQWFLALDRNTGNWKPITQNQTAPPSLSPALTSISNYTSSLRTMTRSSRSTSDLNFIINTKKIDDTVGVHVSSPNSSYSQIKPISDNTFISRNILGSSTSKSYRNNIGTVNVNKISGFNQDATVSRYDSQSGTFPTDNVTNNHTTFLQQGGPKNT